MEKRVGTISLYSHWKVYCTFSKKKSIVMAIFVDTVICFNSEKYVILRKYEVSFYRICLLNKHIETYNIYRKIFKR